MFLSLFHFSKEREREKRKEKEQSALTLVTSVRVHHLLLYTFWLSPRVSSMTALFIYQREKSTLALMLSTGCNVSAQFMRA